MLRYLSGPTPESRQFDFLIGEWEVAASRYQDDGSVQFHYPARWRCVHLNDARMVMDDFKAYGPGGQAISSYVTLRTYSAANGRWEMVGLAAFQPAVPAQWFGEWREGEMRMNAIGAGPAGETVQTRIRFFDIAQDHFAWESHARRGDAATWVRTASLHATRVAG